jgi:hypothetical protein
MIHVILIVLHATFATLGFVLGCLLLARLPEAATSRRFVVYSLSIWVAMLLLFTVVIVDWSELDLIKRIAFTGLSGLGVYLLWRTERARAALRARRDGWRPRFIGHVGFVLISLFDGFCIVTAIDLHLPPVLIAVIAVLGVLAGIWAIRRATKREIANESGSAGVAKDPRVS